MYMFFNKKIAIKNKDKKTDEEKIIKKRNTSLILFKLLYFHKPEKIPKESILVNNIENDKI